ncbi:hypothetical protein [Agromyces sp. NPDC049794]|uniref:hypothetical protein n=1 Tax=unclassified Agromyces TaxID=2639701 RepID=UPI0034080D88
MSTNPRPSSSTWATARPRASGRRTGYVAAIVVNVVLFLLINAWPTWRALPFLTEATLELIPLVDLSLLAGVVVNVFNLVLDLTWVKAVGEVITSVIALIMLARFWAVFPFAFPEPGFDWALLTRVVLGVAMAGCIISVIVQVVVLVRLGARSRPGRPEQAPD